jgi:hypothetical protein
VRAKLIPIDRSFFVRIAAGKQLMIKCGLFASLSLPTLAQTQAPIEFGLWEGTLVRQTTVSPATALALRQKGGNIPPSLTQRYRVCMGTAKWKKSMDAMTATAPANGCSVLHHEKTPNRLTHSLRCRLPDGSSITVDTDIAWDHGTKSHSTTSVEQVYPGTIGEMKVESKITSHFVTAACGKLAPGESETLP